MDTMLKIGEFSKLSMTTVKALRFYEKEGLLSPAAVDTWSGYRFYETDQLRTAAKIKSYRQLGLSIDEIKSIFSGEDANQILSAKAQSLRERLHDTLLQLSVIEFILEGKDMKYQVTLKEIPEGIVYTAETVLKDYDGVMEWIPSVGQMCLDLNPGMKCADPPYEFCEFLDEEYKTTDIAIRHSEAVTHFGKENEHIKFKTLPAAKVLSIYHQGDYNTMGEAYAFILNYAEKNGYEPVGRIRQSYIDGIWNKESVQDWLTEIQLPVK